MINTWFLNSRYLSLVFIFICQYTLINASGENGWTAISNNDHIKAKTEFSDALAKDSTDMQAIQGMIFLSELEGDKISYEKFITALLRHHWNPHYYRLLGESSELKRSELDPKKDLPKSLDLMLAFLDAYELKYNRQFEEADQALDTILSRLDWSVIGPFQNLNGYGYKEEHPIEKEAFQPKKTYTNHRGLELNWINPGVMNPDGYIDFEDYLLPESSGEAVYFANTFIEVPQSQLVNIGISRSYPVKIWIDDQLVFQHKETIGFDWDAETISLNLSKGFHRILIKYAIGSYYSGIIDKKEFDAFGVSTSSYYMRDSYSDFSNWNGGYRGFYGDDNEDTRNDLGYLKRNFFNTEYSDLLAIRFHSEDNKTLKLKSSASPVAFPKNTFSPSLSEKETIDFFMGLIKKEPQQWFNYFMLFRAYERYRVTQEIEPFFIKALEQHQGNTFFKYLLANVFRINGKVERSYEVMSDIDHSLTPVFSLLYKDLQDLDPENDDQRYFAALQNLLKISPSNYVAIVDMLEYYDTKGMVKERKEFAEKMIKEYSQYEDDLEKYLEDDYKPKDWDINADDRKRKRKKYGRSLKSYKKSIQKRFLIYDYNGLIREYKGKGKEEEVLALYDELIKYGNDPYTHRKDKAKYLFNLSRHDEAREELEKVLKIRPYKSEIFELIGDTYLDEENEEEALKNFKQAEKYTSGSSYSYYSYSKSSLEKKIEQLEGTKKLKNKFTFPELDQIKADTAWYSTYKDEESVILNYTSGIFYEGEGKTHLYNKMVILILTEAGATSWTEYNFNFLGNIDLVKVIKRSGAEITPDRSGTFVVFKNLQPGDIILIEGNTDWTGFNDLGYYLDLFNYFMFHAPIYKASLEVAVPEKEKLNYRLHKLRDTLVKTNKEGFDYYRWEYEKAP